MVSQGEKKSISYWPRHTKNPYPSPSSVRHVTLFSVDEYHLSLLCSMPARALRVLLILGARHNPETGICVCSRQEMLSLSSMGKTNISAALKELAERQLIAKGVHHGTYYLSPKVFRAAHLLF